MTTLARAADTTFSGAYNPLPMVRLPYPTDCLGYFLFGGSDAASKKNLMVPGADLIAVSGGPSAFTANTATLGNGHGYRTPFNVTPAAYTAFVFGDIDTVNADGTGGFPTGSYTPIGSASGFSGVRLLTSGGGQSSALNTGQNAGADTITTTPPSPWRGYTPPSGRQQMQCLVESPLHVTMHLEEGRQIKSWYSTTATLADATTPFSLYIGCALGSSYSRAGAVAIYGRSMSAAEVNAGYLQIRRDLATRGFSD